MENAPSFTYGIEEEYLLVEPDTLDLASEPPHDLIKLAQKNAEGLDGSVSREMLRAQLEVGTGVCRTTVNAAQQLQELRKVAINAAEQHGLYLMACSAHPFAKPTEQKHTNRRRYREMAEDLQFTARRLMVCGMHVHVGIDDPDMRVRVLNGIREYLPLLLALSTSSPFWEGEESGLKSVRPVILDDLPRSGLPDRFRDYAAYIRALNALVDTGVISDASKIWWDARLSAKWPTVEIRMMDVTPHIQDSLALAALCRCLCRMIWRRHEEGKFPDLAPRMVVNENRWRALRYGLDATLIDHAAMTLIPVQERVDILIEGLAEDASALDCTAELEHIRNIAHGKTSADRQYDAYKESLSKGLSGLAAFSSGLLQTIAETKKDILSI